MCINKDEIPDRLSRVLGRKIFINNISIMVVQGYLYVGVYKYTRLGSLSDWMFVFKVAHGTIYWVLSVIEAIAASAQQAPIFLSR